MSVLVSYGICVRNAERFVSDAINSILNQDFPKDKMELIIVDDGSTDKSLDIIKRCLERQTVSYKIFHQSWKGIAAARNVVVKASSGRYIVWVDSDMVLQPNYTKKQVDFMEKNPRVGAAKGRYGFMNTSSLVALLEFSRVYEIRKNVSKLVGTGGSIYRVKAIKGSGGFDEKISGAGEDIDALTRIKANGWLHANTDAIFFEKFKETWKMLWVQYRWYGAGAHFVRQYNKKDISIVVRFPPVAFLTGLYKFLLIFKRARNPYFILLPIHNLFKETAWLLGYLQASSKERLKKL
jgi:glycosyltransferase involved in cell wall biosynthesis